MTLRKRIVSLAVGAAVAVLLLFAIPLWLSAQRSASHEVEQAAIDATTGVADYVSAANGDADLDAYVERANSRDDATPIAVITPEGTTYGPALPGSDKHAGTTYADTSKQDAGERGGDRDGPFLRQSEANAEPAPGGRLVCVEIETTGGPTTVLAFASDATVRSTMTAGLLPLGGAAVGLLVLVGAAAEFVSRRLVRDLDRTADLADAIASGKSVARVPGAGPPEVRRVAHALNELAGRIDELLAAERETAADLSHRLRTPLTALRLDVESLPESEARRELEDHMDSLERTLTAVIHMARRSDREGTRVACAPGPVVTASAGYWQPLIEDQGRTMEISIEPDLPEVHCSADDLRAAIDALVENAIAHTPECTPIAVRAGIGCEPDDAVVIEVRDKGDGFSTDAIRRGRSDRGSTGLGLDIARGCAKASGGDFSVLRDDHAVAKASRNEAAAPWMIVQLRMGLA